MFLCRVFWSFRPTLWNTENLPDTRATTTARRRRSLNYLSDVRKSPSNHLFQSHIPRAQICARKRYARDTRRARRNEERSTTMTTHVHIKRHTYWRCDVHVHVWDKQRGGARTTTATTLTTTTIRKGQKSADENHRNVSHMVCGL